MARKTRPPPRANPVARHGVTGCGKRYALIPLRLSFRAQRGICSLPKLARMQLGRARLSAVPPNRKSRLRPRRETTVCAIANKRRKSGENLGTDGTFPGFLHQKLGYVPSVPEFSEWTARERERQATGGGGRALPHQFVILSGADGSRKRTFRGVEGPRVRLSLRATPQGISTTFL